MKKTAIILGAVLMFFTATVKAQNDTLPKQPAQPQQQLQPTQPTQPPASTMQQDQLTSQQPVTATTNSGDKWNNWSPDKYKMLPMPEPLTNEKIFPVLGNFSVTEKSNATTSTASTSDMSAMDNTTGTSSTVSITLDESNKGIVWVDGLPQGKIKAYLRKSPSTYMIPAQKTIDDKDLPGGVLIYDKDANNLDVCIGCKYNNEDPASSFTAPQPVEDQPVVKTKTKSRKVVKKTKVKPVKVWRYSGSKTDVTASSSSTPVQQ